LARPAYLNTERDNLCADMHTIVTRIDCPVFGARRALFYCGRLLYVINHALELSAQSRPMAPTLPTTFTACVGAGLADLHPLLALAGSG
jgi:hypothetical protein